MALLRVLPLILLLGGCFLRSDNATEGTPVDTLSEIEQPAPQQPPHSPARQPVAQSQPDSETESIELQKGSADVALEPAPDYISPLCYAVGNKLGSVSVRDCLNAGLSHSTLSPGKFSLAWRNFGPRPERKSLGRVLVIGGIHGDEFSSISLMFRWMEILEQHHSGLFHWRFIPLANPDGLLREISQRQNEAGVDLNRNFPTRDWDEDAKRYWSEVTYHNPRRNPGAAAASESETQWLVSQIEDFAPDVIVSVHAPHHLVDYDGPPSAPERLGRLNLAKQGVFPGSLGNYAGHDLGLPVVTVELQSAGIMPSNSEISGMWTDLVQWLRAQLDDRQVVNTD